MTTRGQSRWGPRLLGTWIPMTLGCTSWFALLFGLYAFTDGSWRDADLRQLLMPPLLGLASAAFAGTYERSARRTRARSMGMAVTILVLVVCATAIAVFLFALPEDLPRLPGWWNLPAAAMWALLALVTGRLIAKGTEPDPSRPEDRGAAHLRVRDRHADARQSAWEYGGLAAALLLLVGVAVAEGDVGWSTMVGGGLALLLAASAVRSWRRSRAVLHDEVSTASG